MIAWDRKTHARIWQRASGLHRNDLGPLPRRTVVGLPGAARRRRDADGARGRTGLRPRRRPLLPRERDGTRDARQGDRYARAKASSSRSTPRPARGCGLGRFPSPNFGCATVANDVVFTSTFDGTVYGLESGRPTLAQARAPPPSTLPRGRRARCSSSPGPIIRPFQPGARADRLRPSRPVGRLQLQWWSGGSRGHGSCSRAGSWP